VFVLRGRIHMNEVPYSTKLANMVRLQIEMFRHLGVERFVLTAAVGGLVRGHGPGDQQAKTGTVGIANGFVTVFAPDMPLYGGEFVAVESTLDPELRRLALEACSEVGLEGFEGGHVMVRGPQFEGTRYDKLALAESGAKMVGMSVLPEACVAALWGAKVLVLGFVSNDDAEAHSDELVQTRVKAAADKLGALIRAISRRFKTL
jgi:purine nucleoside phosphorylase